MQDKLAELKVRAVVPTITGCAIFLTAADKSFVIYVDPSLGEAIANALQGKEHERPLTHELIGCIFIGLEVTLQQVVINDMNENAFFARIFLKMKNELGEKMVEIDARPSDAIVLALQAKKPIRILHDVLDSVEDMTQALEQILKKKEGL